MLTGKERFIRALDGKLPEGRVPHFELVFFLTMEVLGRVHPQHRDYSSWNQMEEKERRLHIDDMAHCFVDIAKKYQHDAIFVQSDIERPEITVPLLKRIDEIGEGKYFLILHGDGTFAIPDGSSMVDFSAGFFEEPGEMLKIAQKKIDSTCRAIDVILQQGAPLDGVGLCSDYCFNDNPFFSPSMFETFVFPFLKEEIRRYHDMGLRCIKHTDGNILPILDQMAAAGPDALHSLDPQGGVDLKKVKQLYGDKICLIGNVNCGLLQTGTREQVLADARRALRDGMGEDGRNYIFSTSNCVYTGLPLERYEMIHNIWLEEGIPPAQRNKKCNS